MLGFRKAVIQAFVAVISLCMLFSIWKQRDVRTVFGQEHEVHLPILMYHSILKDGAYQGKYVLHPNLLASDLDYLQQQGYQTVTISDLLAYVYEGIALPEKPVMITFDDGYYNNYTYAYPLLETRGMKAVVSIIGSQTALYSDNGQENAYWSHLSAARLLEMQNVFEVQNHSWDLHEYGERRGCLRQSGEDADDYEKFLRDDTMQTQEFLQKIGMSAPSCYTYPFGAYSQESEKILRNIGFLSTLVCEERWNVITRDPECLYALGRYNRPSGVSTLEFMKKVGI